jgi:hypothetical protein
MKEIKVLILVIFLCVGCSGKIKNGYNYDKAHLSPAMYKMLGMLAEYLSRYKFIAGGTKKGLIETFYPHEARTSARVFENLIEQYRKEERVDFEYYKEIGDQGHIFFYSEELSEVFNSFYVVWGREAILDRTIFFDADIGSKLAFIEGVYLRFGYKNANLIRMANAFNKIDIVGFVLKSLGCRNVYIYETWGTIPRGVELIFDPDDLLKKLLMIESVLSKGYFKDKEDFHFCKEVEGG